MITNPSSVTEIAGMKKTRKIDVAANQLSYFIGSTRTELGLYDGAPRYQLQELEQSAELVVVASRPEVDRIQIKIDDMLAAGLPEDHPAVKKARVMLEEASNGGGR